MEFSRKRNAIALFFLSLPFLVYLCFVPLPDSLLEAGKMVVTNSAYLVGRGYVAPASLTDSIEIVGFSAIPTPIPSVTPEPSLSPNPTPEPLNQVGE